MRTTAARLVQCGQKLQIEDVELPEPAEGDVLLDIAYSGVNPVDIYAAQGKVSPNAPVPRTLGTEGAGTVGGRRVMVHGHGIGTARDGLWATRAVVPRTALIEIPERVPLEAAAAMGVAGLTAWRTVS
jgi:NADPH:quinone reductase-like Zn-dependent oxidoreductase